MWYFASISRGWLAEGDALVSNRAGLALWVRSGLAFPISYWLILEKSELSLLSMRDGAGLRLISPVRRLWRK